MLRVQINRALAAPGSSDPNSPCFDCDLPATESIYRPAIDPIGNRRCASFGTTEPAAFLRKALSCYPRARRRRENGHKWCRRLAGAVSLSHKCLQLLQEDGGVFSYTVLFAVTSEVENRSPDFRQTVQRDRVGIANLTWHPLAKFVGHPFQAPPPCQKPVLAQP